MDRPKLTTIKLTQLKIRDLQRGPNISSIKHALPFGVDELCAFFLPTNVFRPNNSHTIGFSFNGLY